MGLDQAPPGMHNDEASIAYNAWTLVHYGTDQYGTHWPLLFRDFGDYKGPVSTYALAPLLLFLPPSSAVTRLPSALAGIALALAAALLAWRLTRSRAVALIVLFETAFEPWLFHTARINLEADLFTVFAFVVVLVVLARTESVRPRDCLVAGLALGLAPLAAQPGRFFALVFLALVAVTHRRSLGWKRIAVIAGPVLVASTLLFVATPAAAAARLGDVSVFNHQAVWSGVVSWFSNYARYLSPDFLFVHGDPNLRHSSGFGGLLLVTALPVLVAGVVSCVRRWRDPMRRLALIGLVVAPLGPAITTGISARRNVVVLPFVILLLVYGWEVLVPWLRGGALRTAAAATCVAVAAGLYFADYATAYPGRAAVAFDAGEVHTLSVAHRAAGEQTLYVSSRVQDVAELALVAILPPPSASGTLQRLRISVLASPAALSGASPGTIVVLASGEQPPGGFTLLASEATADVYVRG